MNEKSLWQTLHEDAETQEVDDDESERDVKDTASNKTVEQITRTGSLKGHVSLSC